LHRDVSPEPTGREVLVCRDCAARLDAAGRQADADRAPNVSRRVSEWLSAAYPEYTFTFPDDFGQLADLGDETHLATIYIDGNRIGALFEAVARAGGKSKRELARGIDGATRDGLVAGLTAILPTAEGPPAEGGTPQKVTVPAIAHLVGGDDVLLSVPAAAGWGFAEAFLEAFTESLAAWSRKSGLPLSGPAPSASAGLVVHHHKHPFALIVDSAAETLSYAKSQMSGQEGAVAWVDVSSTGSQLHGPRAAAWLAENRSTLRALSKVKPAQRSRLGHTSDEDLRSQVNRMKVEPAQVLLREGGPLALEDALSIVRWWNHG